MSTIISKSVKGRTHTVKLCGEHSTIDYKIVASSEIIIEIIKATEAILAKYPKNWEKKGDK